MDNYSKVWGDVEAHRQLFGHLPDDDCPDFSPNDIRYALAKYLKNDERSMNYIAKKLGYAHPSSVDYLLKHYTRRTFVDKH